MNEIRIKHRRIKNDPVFNAMQKNLSDFIMLSGIEKIIVKNGEIEVVYANQKIINSMQNTIKEYMQYLYGKE